jgi:hypothetical protein
VIDQQQYIQISAVARQELSAGADVEAIPVMLKEIGFSPID